MGSNDSTRIQTACAVLNSYSALTVEALLKPLADDFIHQVFPSSLEFPPRDRESFAAHASGVTSIFSSFAMVPHNMFEDASKNTVIVQAKMVGELHGMGKWENECVIFMKMLEDGTKVVETTEFVDSLRSKQLQEKLMAGSKGNVLKNDV
ncbi:uncharacterized protein LY89DRAFT_681836 [Mollisia scopiformis]|uniref:SnoaL-like domain-containing protein n=1 Tax=Mollisia scopiformis TaxID=149040 RepID=A0A194XMA6_MOLSC|nr:uncharacterized protein LY89DRAFT_681836 [Mollisia scopiformis]KUJ21256.1 hypothetical protein LY89DRAFT_681836 [Mollisia scopiformis]